MKPGVPPFDAAAYAFTYVSNVAVTVAASSSTPGTTVTFPAVTIGVPVTAPGSLPLGSTKPNLCVVALYVPTGMWLNTAQPSEFVVSPSEVGPAIATSAPGAGSPSRSVTLTVSVPRLASKAATGGATSDAIVTGLVIAELLTVDVMRRWSACELLTVQLSTPLASRIQSAREST